MDVYVYRHKDRARLFQAFTNERIQSSQGREGLNMIRKKTAWQLAKKEWSNNYDFYIGQMLLIIFLGLLANALINLGGV